MDRGVRPYTDFSFGNALSERVLGGHAAHAGGRLAWEGMRGMEGMRVGGRRRGSGGKGAQAEGRACVRARAIHSQ